MEIGGVLLGSGMEMDLAEGDYLAGKGRVRFIVGKIVEIRREWEEDWVVLAGAETPPTAPHWRPRWIWVRVSALSRSLTLV